MRCWISFYELFRGGIAGIFDDSYGGWLGFRELPVMRGDGWDV